MNKQHCTEQQDVFNRKKKILEEFLLISKACAYSQGVLVLEVLVQEGQSALLNE